MIPKTITFGRIKHKKSLGLFDETLELMDADDV